MLVCQPHILTKALYVKDDAAVRSYLWIFCLIFTLFALLFGALWLREPVTPGLVAALVLVAAGIVLVNRRPG